MSADAGRGRTIGVLLAAGRGTRLGGTKQLLPLPHSTPVVTLVAAAFDLIAGACDEVVVVLGHEASAVAAALGQRVFTAVESDPDAEMFDSVRAGLAAALERGAQLVVLHPADHPAVRRETVATLVAAARASSGARGFVPTLKGRGGHPVVIPAPLCAQLLTWRGSGGLRGFWREASERWSALAVDDPGVRIDVDTPTDYHRL